MVALNFNGQSSESSVYAFNACKVPVMNAIPFKIASTTASITVGWDHPIDDGGCPITGFAVFRDDGAGSAITDEVNSVSDTLVRNIPTLNSLVVTNFPVSSEGLTFRFQITVFNKEGSSLSNIGSILYAGVPNTPTSAPVID